MDIDCYDLRDCTGECPPGGWDDCPVNPEVGRELAFVERHSAAIRVAGWCFLLMALIAAIAWALPARAAESPISGDGVPWGWCLAALALAFVTGRYWSACEPSPHELLVRLDDERRRIVEYDKRIERLEAEKGAIRERLGHRMTMRRDAAGFHYVACARCGLDKRAVVLDAGLEGCGGVSLTDEEWKAKLDDLARRRAS